MTTNICIFGDSIAWGASDAEQGGWVARLKKHYESQGFPVDEDIDVYNLGVSGDNTGDLLERLDVELKARLSDGLTLVVFAIGINDSQFVIPEGRNRVPIDKFKDNLKKLLSMTRKYSEKIAFIGLTQVDESRTTPAPWNTDKEYKNEDILKYDVALQEIAKSEGATYIDMKDVVPIENLKDGLHPDSTGHQKMFESIHKNPFFTQS